MKNNTLLKITALLFTVFSMAMVGCSKKEAPKPVDSGAGTTFRAAEYYNNQNNPMAQEQRRRAREQQEMAAMKAADNALGQGDPNTPLSAYHPFRDGGSVVGLYYSMETPVNYDELAEILDPHYPNIDDTFKKSDRLKALKPKIDEDIAIAAKYKYLKLDMRLLLNSYDMQSKSFDINVLNYVSGNNPLNSGSYSMQFTNDDKVSKLTVTDENLAREIEALRTKDINGIHANGYIFVQGVAKDDRNVKVKVMKLDLLDNKGKVIFSE